MQVTLGEEGSPPSARAGSSDDEERPTLLLRDTVIGLDRARLRLPLLPRSSLARPGAGSFSALPGLDETRALGAAAGFMRVGKR